MLYSSAGLLALIIHLIINHDVLWNSSARKIVPAHRSYRQFLVAVTVYYVSDICWGLLYERHLIALCFVDTEVYFVSMAFSILLWTRYVIAYLQERDRFGRALAALGWLIFSFQMLVVVVNFFAPVLFFFDADGAYHAQATRYITLILQIFMFLTTAVYAFFVTARSSGTKKLRHRTIGLFSVAMTGFAIGQAYFPLLPLYALGCLLGSCVLHSFVLENEKDEYRDELEGRLQESILKGNYYDLLTGLPGMTYFYELIEAKRSDMTKKGCKPVFLYLNLSGLKFYNQKHGFTEGDRLLRSFAQLLVSVFGNENCSRFGQDHFAVFTTDEDVEGTLTALFRDWAAANPDDCPPILVGICPDNIPDMGISMAYDYAKIACDAVHIANASTFRYFDSSMFEKAEQQQYIIAHLDQAIAEGWIQVHYQAIVRAAGGKVCDEEALSRWIDPNKGFLSPADFIPALEASRLIYKLDLYVVEQVLQKLKKQAEAGMYVVPQSVNLSRMDFDSCDIVEEIRRRVDDAGIDRSMLTIEITESVIGSDFDFMKAQVERFRKLGFQVWMDDFGSGYSSMDVLQSIHFDLIKLDMRFMQQFDSGDESKIILTELVRMALGLGVETVCEGVEREEQVVFLREIGCTKIQGYYYCKPLSLDALLERNALGKDMGFENPEETEYYATVGRVNLYDMAMVNDDDSLRRYFDTVPMAIMEVNDDEIHYARCNKSYRDFMRRVFGIELTGREMDRSRIPGGHGAAFMGAVLRCSRDGNRAVIDEPIDDGTTIHTFIRRVAVNPVKGTTAIAVAVLAIMEESGNTGASFASVNRALSSDYVNLYYVDMETDQFIEYTPDAGREDLAVERRGADFFNASLKDAQLFIYGEDREYFVKSFTKENVLKAIDGHGTFTLTYRLMVDGVPTYVSMKAVRMRADMTHIIVGVSNVDAQMRQKEAMARLQAEQTTYSRIKALTKGFICIYTVDPATGRYSEYSASEGYTSLDLDKEGDDFWARAREESVRHVYSEDIEKFQTLMTRDRVMEEIGKNGLFSIQYRMYLDGDPKYVTVQAALVEEKDGPQLIIGVNNVDDLVRREQDFERKLAAARSRANLDTLTGVKNRTAYENMTQTLTKQIESGQPVRYAIALCRVSDYGCVLQAQGQEAGDDMIRRACAVICNAYKHSPVFRVNEDQFAAIVQGQDYDRVDELTAELRQHSGEGDVAIACGMAKYDGSGSVASVFERADALCRIT